MKDLNKIESLKNIEKFLFKDRQSLVVIDLNAKVWIPKHFENFEKRSIKF